jgi:2-succinyl-6-hydroxy-2,4-cyclohexadiene-1-carboxylate synthase
MRLHVNGIAYHVETAGAGPALLLLHGFTGSVRSWDRFVPGWAERCRVVAVDLIGHGETEAPDDPERYTMAHTVQDLAAILDALDIERAAVLGYSMGGRTALSLAATHPERVRALLLESASPGLATAEERAARIRQDEALADRIERDGIARFVEEWENLPLFASLKAQPPETQRRIRAQRLNNRPRGLANSLRGMGTGRQPSWWEALPALAMPVLLIAGEWDAKFTAIARRMAEALPHSTFAPVPNAGHLVHVEQADLFDTIVREFLFRHADP